MAYDNYFQFYLIFQCISADHEYMFTCTVLLYQIKMNTQAKARKNQSVAISVLQLPLKNQLIQLDSNSPESEYLLYKLSDKKSLIEAYKIQIQKSQLFKNIQIYQWRRQTQFPISKTYFVNIKPNNLHMTNNLQLVVYNQHCPHRLDFLGELPLPQAIYILKEAFLGFERLFNRFGSFHVTSNMIRFNDKGFCKVWINENFGINNIMKPEGSQCAMVISILQIIQNCFQQKKGKKLLIKLRECKSFLAVLKQIESYTSVNKISIPSRFSSSQSQSNSPDSPKIKINVLNKFIKNECLSPNNVRTSTISNDFQNVGGSFRDKHPTSLERSAEKKPNQIKKIKSFESLNGNEVNIFVENTNNISNSANLNTRKSINDKNILKVSHQTAYTRNFNHTKCSNMNPNFNSPRQDGRQSCNNRSESNMTAKFGQIIMGTNKVNIVMGMDEHKSKQKKKDLYYSKALINPEDRTKGDLNLIRSLSEKKNSNELHLNLGQCHFDNSFTMDNNSKFTFNDCIDNKKVARLNRLSDEFNNVLNEDVMQLPKTSPRKRQKQSLDYDDSEQQLQQKLLRASHTISVMKSNGWKCTTGGFLDVHKQLNESFHEGKQQNAFLKDIKLLKLDSMGKRAAAMSIIPHDEHEQL